MNIVKTIAKFVKDGLSALSAEEITLLEENISLMSPAQKQKFEDESEETSEENTEENTEEATEESTEESTEEEIEEKELKSLIAKSVKDEVSSKVEAIAEKIVTKFVKGAAEQRKKALETGIKVKDESRESTRRFMKALLSGDRAGLVEFQKTTTFNQSGDDARGGYLIPEELLAVVLRIAEEQYGVARREFQYLPFSGPGNERKIPTLASSVTVYWVNESGSKTSSNPTFGLVTQTLKKLAAIVPMTEEIIEDSAINLTELVAKLFAEAVSKEEDLQFFNGTGSPWTGILNNGSVNSVSLGTGETVADITIEKLIDMQDETPTGALSGAKYYMNRQIYNYLRKLRADAITASDSKGVFILPPTKADIEGILGFPIEFVEAMPGKTLAVADDAFVILGNLKISAIFGDKQQIRAKLLDQATITDGDGETSINLAVQDMIALRLEERVGYVFALPTAITVLKTGSAS